MSVAFPAPHPGNADAGDFGPELAALVAYLMVVCRMPRRVVEALLGQVLGIEIIWAARRSARRKPVTRWQSPVRNWKSN